MEPEHKGEAGQTADDGAVPAYEVPEVESVLTTSDLEREVMHGIISQT